MPPPQTYEAEGAEGTEGEGERRRKRCSRIVAEATDAEARYCADAGAIIFLSLSLGGEKKIRRF